MVIPSISVEVYGNIGVSRQAVLTTFPEQEICLFYLIFAIITLYRNGTSTFKSYCSLEWYEKNFQLC